MRISPSVLPQPILPPHASFHSGETLSIIQIYGFDFNEALPCMCPATVYWILSILDKCTNTADKAVQFPSKETDLARSTICHNRVSNSK